MTTRGRPKGQIEFDAEFVRDISEQVMIAYYNDNQEELRKALLRDPDTIAHMRARASKGYDPKVRAVLRAVRTLAGRKFDSVKEYQAEICYEVYLDQLEEPPGAIKKALAEGRGPIYRERSKLYTTTVSRILAAHTRVMSGKPLKLKRPPLVQLNDDEEDSVW